MASEVGESREPERPGEVAASPQVRQHYEAIRHKEQEVRRLESVFFDYRRAAKNAKEQFDAADQELRNLIADGLDPQAKLPFPSETEVAEDPDTWRSVSLNELVLPEKLREKLFAAGVETIGELEDLRAKIADGKADWPKGFGTAKITAVEDSVLTWLTDHRDHFRQPVAESGLARAA